MKQLNSGLQKAFYGFLLIVSGQAAIAQNVCPPNIDFEFGDWSNWQIYAGLVSSTGGVRTFNLNATAPLPGRHSMINPTTAFDPYGGFPVNSNGSAGGYSIRLGFPNEGTPNANCERIRYQFTIPSGATSYSLTYKYAVVFENPAGHQSYEQPQFEAKVFNVTTGQYIGCASFEYYATSGLPGFSQATQLSNHGAVVFYKPWTPVTVNLSAYAGQTIALEFTNSDCTLTGHWAYSYIDVSTGCDSPISGADFCPGSTSVNVIAPYGYQNYTWYNSGFGTPLTTNQTLTLTPPPAVPTVYAVDVVPFPGFGCRDTIYATVKPYPVVPVNAGQDRILCPNNSSQGPSTLGSQVLPGYTYSWSPVTGLNDATIAQPIATPTATTDYILTVTDTATGCQKKDTVTVNVAPSLSGAFTINSPNQCLAGNSYQFTSSTANAAGTVFNWNFGNGIGTSNQASPSYTYPAAGSFTVKLIVSNASGCIDSSSQAVIVSAQALADAGADKALCGGTVSSTVIGTPALTGYTYSWSPTTNLDNANIAQPTASPPTTTSYIVTATGPGGCTKKDTMTVIVAPSISGTFTVNNANQCLGGNNYQFTSNPSNPAGLNYAWYFGQTPGPNSTLQNPSFQYTAAGTYTVKVVVSASGGGCADSSTQTVTVNAMPLANAGADKLLCGGTGSSTQIGTAAVTGYTYSWSPAAGLSSTNVAQPNASPTTTTDYIVSVTGAGGCITKDTVRVTVTQALSSGFTVNNANQCITGNNFQFTMSSPIAGLTYSWNFGDNQFSTQQNPSHTYATAGSYTVKVNLTSANGCKDSSTQTVTVSAVPTATLSSPGTIICEGTPVVLTATGTTATTYKWYKDGVLVATTTSNTYGATQAGTYTFTLDNGCLNNGTGSITLTLTRKPTVDFSFSLRCLGFPATFTDGSNVSGSLPVNYSWNFGTTSIPNSTQATPPAVTYPTAGTYNVQFTVTPQNCPSLATTATRPVTVKGPTPNTRYPDKAALENVPLQLQARNIGSSYAWSPGTSLNNAAIMQPIFNGMLQQDYTITITDNLGCVTVDSQLVKVFKEVNIFVPKAFTPNGDAQNDRMFPLTIGIRQVRMFRIINRWGVIVYEAKNDLPGWDGLYKGAPQPMDGYVWELQAVDYFGKMHTRSGTFTLIR